MSPHAPKGIWAPRYQFPVHCVQACFATAVSVMSAVRLTIEHETRDKVHTIGLAIGIKSLVIIAYELITEHVPRFEKWRSLKAIAIVNAIEIIVWLGCAGLTFQANIAQCIGVGCSLSWAISALAAVMTVLSMYAAHAANLEYRSHRRERKAGLSRLNSSDPELEKIVTAYGTPR